ncbi:MAG: RnfABCDGE type electron transport complex subunit B [Brachymonas sp.]|nr:RnfABCDGE type electron transport complex subunit B [Brachymonas sp.]
MAEASKAPSEKAAPLQPLTAQAQRIHAVLPQTQCQRCGEPDCAAYAQAIADGRVGIHQCPPGGKEGIARIAAALGQPALAEGLDIDPSCGKEGPMTVAVIDEHWCIGCTLCIKACPTDAIVGSHKRMHTVLEDYCTGCDLCVLACPVDCIAMENTSGNATGWAAWTQPQADQALQRYTARQLRKHASATSIENPLQGQTAQPSSSSQTAVPDPKHAIIEAALARARRQRVGDK